MNGGSFVRVKHLEPTSSFDDDGRFHSTVQLTAASAGWTYVFNYLSLSYDFMPFLALIMSNHINFVI